ncbi:MAG: MarR family transcriptional regulator [Ktedonobacteraceae bacterium]
MQWPQFVLKVLGTKRLSGEEKRVLLAVAAKIDPRRKGALTQSEIGDVVGMTQPSVSATVTSLEAKGYLTKEDAKRGKHKIYGLGGKLRKFAATAGEATSDVVEHELTLEGGYKITVSKKPA